MLGLSRYSSQHYQLNSLYMNILIWLTCWLPSNQSAFMWRKLIFRCSQFSLRLSNYFINMLAGWPDGWLVSGCLHIHIVNTSAITLVILSGLPSPPSVISPQPDHPAVRIQVLYYSLQFTLVFTCLMVSSLAIVATIQSQGTTLVFFPTQIEGHNAHCVECSGALASLGGVTQPGAWLDPRVMATRVNHTAECNHSGTRYQFINPYVGQVFKK